MRVGGVLVRVQQPPPPQQVSKFQINQIRSYGREAIEAGGEKGVSQAIAIIC